MHKLLFLISFLTFQCGWVYSQSEVTVTGYVYDALSNEPLLGAFIYYEGTTVGVITNDKGFFSITTANTTTSTLIVSYLGYEDTFIQPSDKPIKVYLKESAESLDTVFIDANPLFKRKQLLKVFKEQFLGETKAGRSCEILNDEVIDLYYDKNTFELTATADQAIIIRNNHLGYDIKYKLYDFKVNYVRPSIESFAIKKSYYVGTSFFIDKAQTDDKYLKRRKKEYQGSVLQLMRTIANESYKSNKFTFFKKGFRANPKNYLKVKDTLQIKKVALLHPLSILYNKKQQSKIESIYSAFYIDNYGNFYPPDAILFSGELGKKRMGNALPLDYILE